LGASDAGLDTEMHAEADSIDEQPVFDKPFSALDLDGDNDSPLLDLRRQLG